MSVFTDNQKKRHRKLTEVKIGEYFSYGGIEWIKLDQNGDRTVVISTGPVFERSFDEKNCNDWRESSLRRELNGVFLNALIAKGADLAAFMGFESDLTADDGMTDYGTARDKIALISCGLYRKYRTLLPKIKCCWWTLTPWTCYPEYSYSVRHVSSIGAMHWGNASNGSRGVCPLCHLKSSIFVSVPDEDRMQMNRGEAIEKARGAGLEVLNDCPESLLRDAIETVVKALFERKLPEEMAVIKNCKFSSVWDDGIEIITNCRVNTDTKEVFDIDAVDTNGLEALYGEYVIIDGKGFPVSRRSEGCTEYWYE